MFERLLGQENCDEKLAKRVIGLAMACFEHVKLMASCTEGEIRLLVLDRQADGDSASEELA